MWGTPAISSHPSNGMDTALIVLDSEGLFAANVTEIYDAKIFAIATLLSSYLIYNSVNIIDQSAIDDIECVPA